MTAIERSMGALHEAAYNADLSLVLYMLNSGAAVDERDLSGYTALLWCCFRGRVGDQLPVVRALLAAGADPNAPTGNGDANCLVLAAQCGAVDLIKELVSAGAEPNRTTDGVTPLMQAAREGEEEAVSTLLELGAHADLVAGGFTAADYARYYGHEELAIRLTS